MITALTLPDFNTPDDITYGFFGRQGGVSTGIYDSLNCRAGSDDNKDNILANRKRVCETLGTPLENLLTVYQIHSEECVLLEKPWRQSKRPKADAMVTKTTGIALGILTADCTPVLFHGKNAEGKPIIGAAHAGWKGAIGGILEETITMMKRAGAGLNTIHVAIGPTIAQESYEVGAEFYKHFKDYSDRNEKFFIPSKKDDHYMFDLPAYVTHRLTRAGVTNITNANIDTYTNKSNYFSYRRTTHANEPDYGGQISAIMIKGVIPPHVIPLKNETSYTINTQKTPHQVRGFKTKE